MLHDIAYIWWALIIAYGLHRILWFCFQILGADFFRRRIGWSIIPDIFVAFGSINLFWALIGWWNVSGSVWVYGAVVYMLIANAYALLRYVQSQSVNGKRISLYWWAGLNIGFLLFGLQRLVLG